jgi:hypothetical protein
MRSPPGANFLHSGRRREASLRQQRAPRATRCSLHPATRPSSAAGSSRTMARPSIGSEAQCTASFWVMSCAVPPTRALLAEVSLKRLFSFIYVGKYVAQTTPPTRTDELAEFGPQPQRTAGERRFPGPRTTLYKVICTPQLSTHVNITHAQFGPHRAVPVPPTWGWGSRDGAARRTPGA